VRKGEGEGKGKGVLDLPRLFDMARHGPP
jgi:hypothetical protein